MHIVFLGSPLPLTKTFSKEPNGAIITAPYPQVSKVTSHHERATTIADFHALLLTYAKRGACLFGGQLQRPIKNESRAGLTDKQPREWVVFDFDKVDGTTPEEVVKKYLPPVCHNVSYVAQLSPSMFKPGTTKWSGHIFMLLKKPADERLVKQWFEWINFHTPALESQITLSDSEHALHWPLDRVVAYTSRIIYIAPPKCHGFEPAVKESITLVKKRTPALDLPNFTPITHDEIRSKINALRTAIGLDPLTYALTAMNGEDVLDVAGVCEVHGVRTSGDHYIRFNLNGGDSYAYYIDLRSPALIRNFKGEPSLKTEQVAPELYKSLRKIAPRVVAKQPLEEGTDVLAFYATNQGSPVTIGTFSPIERKLTLYPASETSAKAWLAEYGIPNTKLLPHMNITFNPHSDVQYVPGTTIINSFRATDYMVKERAKTPSTLTEIPATIDKTMRSMLGTPSVELYSHFVNWLAFIFQYREKTQAAWIIHGTTGTGKGVFVREILTPLFGAQHVRTVQFGLVMTNFNAFLDNTLFVVFEECDTKAIGNVAELNAKLKHWITDSPIEINQKNARTYAADNYSNIILFANERTPTFVASDDRRYNIAERQEQSIFYTPNEMRSLLAGDDLDGFADVLARWPVDIAQAHRIIKTKARQDMHESSTPVNQLIAEAITAGDLQFFVDRMPTQIEAQADFHNRFNPYSIFKPILDNCIQHARRKQPMILEEGDLFLMFRTLIPDTKYFQDAKAWRLRHYKALGLDTTKQHRDPKDSSKRVRGIRVEWQMPNNLPEPVADKRDDTVVTPLRKKAR